MVTCSCCIVRPCLERSDLHIAYRHLSSSSGRNLPFPASTPLLCIGHCSSFLHCTAFKARIIKQVMDHRRHLADFTSNSSGAPNHDSPTRPRVRASSIRSRPSYQAAERYFSQHVPDVRKNEPGLSSRRLAAADDGLDDFGERLSLVSSECLLFTDRRLLEETAHGRASHHRQASVRTRLPLPPCTPMMSTATDTSRSGMSSSVDMRCV
jgi:hypothetical protein